MPEELPPLLESPSPSSPLGAFAAQPHARTSKAAR
jgi:hypothetical protein